MKSIYIIGSLRNPKIPVVATALRALGYDAFDDWFAAGEFADDAWMAYEKAKGLSFSEALSGYAAQHVFRFDKNHLQRCDLAVLLMPAGKSGHLELGYASGLGKPTFIVLEKEPERFDVMYAFASEVFSSIPKFIAFMADPDSGI